MLLCRQHKRSGTRRVIRHGPAPQRDTLVNHPLPYPGVLLLTLSGAGSYVTKFGLVRVHNKSGMGTDHVGSARPCPDHWRPHAYVLLLL